MVARSTNSGVQRAMTPVTIESSCGCLQHDSWWLSIKSELTSGIVEQPLDCLQHDSAFHRMVTTVTTEAFII